MRKISPHNLLIIVLLASLVLAACAQTATPLLPTQLPAEPTSLPEPTATAPEPTATSAPTQEPEPIQIALNDAMGATITLQAPAQRIVSLAPANTEILYAIGAGQQVVGRDQFSDFPEEAQQASDIGDITNLNTELIVTLKPDLVLASALTSPEQVQALQDLGLIVFTMPNPTDLEGMYESLRIVAQLSGHEAEAEALIEALQTRVAAVDEKVAGVQERPLVFYELDATDPNAVWTPGPGTYIDQLITRAGGENLGGVLGSDWAQISLEELVSKDPDLILLGDAQWGGVTSEAVAARPGWQTLSAVMEGKIYPFDDNLVSRPGPRLVDGLEALAKFLHPELFE